MSSPFNDEDFELTDPSGPVKPNPQSAQDYGLWDRFKDAYGAGALHSPYGAEFVVRRDLKARGYTDDQINQYERRLSDIYAQRAAAHPVRQGGPYAAQSSALNGVVNLIGGTLGGVDPTYVMGAGKSIATRIMSQMGIQGLSDYTTQKIEQSRGVRDNYDPMETAIAAGTGAVIQGAHELAHIIPGRMQMAHGASAPDFNRALAITKQSESGGNPNAVSKAGAKGLMQVMDATAAAPGHGIAPAKNLEDRTRVGTQLFAALLGKYNHDYEKAWGAYNWGEGNLDHAVEKYGHDWYRHAPDETQNYVAKNMVALTGKTEPPGEMGNGSVGGPVQSMNPEDMARAMNDNTAGGASSPLDVMSPEEYHAQMAENLTPAEHQEMDASAPKPVVDNTGYEAHTPYPQENIPANDEVPLVPGEYGMNPDADPYANMTPEQIDAIRSGVNTRGMGAVEDGIPANDTAFQNTQDARANYYDQRSPLQRFVDTFREMLNNEEGSAPRRPPGGQEPPSGGEPPQEPPSGTPEEPTGDVPAAGPDIKMGPVEKLTKALRTAEPYDITREETRSVERARRIKMSAAVAQHTTGEQGFYAEKAKLGGEMPDARDFNPIRDYFSQGERDELSDMLKKFPTFNFYEKINARDGLQKLFDGKVPTHSEMLLLEKVFPDLPRVLEKPDSTFDTLAKWANLPRSFLASGDLSAPLRQGVFLAGRKEFYSSFAKMPKEMFSPKYYRAVMDNIAADPNYNLMVRSGLSFTDMGKNLADREEQFISPLAEKLPVIGEGIKGSERAYNGFLNKLRADTFNSILSDAKRAGIDIRKDPKFVKDLARYLNNATGRGDATFFGKDFSKAAPFLSAFLFSPRLMMSRFRLLNPLFYKNLHPFVRQEALKDLFAFSSMNATILGLAALGGASVELDPRSTDFAKIKVGDTRIDFLGGFQQYIRNAAQLLPSVHDGQLAQWIKKEDGSWKQLNEENDEGRPKYGSETGMEHVFKFFENKASPVANFADKLVRGFHDPQTGERLTIKGELYNELLPLAFQDTIDALYKYGAKGLAVAPPAIFGAGVQTYKEQEKAPKADNTFGADPFKTDVRGGPFDDSQFK